MPAGRVVPGTGTFIVTANALLPTTHRESARITGRTPRVSVQARVGMPTFKLSTQCASSLEAVPVKLARMD